MFTSSFFDQLKLPKGNAATRYLAKTKALTTPIGAANLAKLNGIELDNALRESQFYTGLAFIRGYIFLSHFDQFGGYIPDDQQKGKEKLETVHAEIVDAFDLPERADDPVEAFLDAGGVVEPLSDLQAQMEREGLFTVVPLHFARPALELYAVQSKHDWMKRYGLLIPDGVDRQRQVADEFDQKAGELKLPRRNKAIIDRRKRAEQQDASPSTTDDSAFEKSERGGDDPEQQHESGIHSDKRALNGGNGSIDQDSESGADDEES